MNIINDLCLYADIMQNIFIPFYDTLYKHTSKTTYFTKVSGCLLQILEMQNNKTHILFLVLFILYS